MQTISKQQSQADLIQGSTGQGKIVTANLKAPIIVLDAPNDYIHFASDSIFIIHANTLKAKQKKAKKEKKQTDTRG